MESRNHRIRKTEQIKFFYTRVIVPHSKARDLFFMKEAFKLAQQAEKEGEVPVGAVLVQEMGEKCKVIARTFNKRESLKQAIAHAEILAIEQAGVKLKRWRLNDCVLYVTLEPCPMCAGALVQARLKSLVYACSDLKAGAVHSLFHITEDSRLNHQVEVRAGILKEESSHLLKNFFQKKRSS